MVFLEVFVGVLLAELCKIVIERYVKSHFEKRLDEVEKLLLEARERAKKELEQTKSAREHDKNNNNNNNI